MRLCTRATRRSWIEADGDMVTLKNIYSRPGEIPHLDYNRPASCKETQTCFAEPLHGSSGGWRKTY